MSKANRRQIERILSDPDSPHSQIMQIPEVLYFPPKRLGDLQLLLEYNECSPGQLVLGALTMQLQHWDEFYELVITPLKPGESEEWREDPMFALACVAFLHWM